MGEKIIAISDLRRLIGSADLRAPASGLAPGADRLDTRGRHLRDLRISVTDRCNFRCRYCMPKEIFDSHHEFLPHKALLTFEEITRLARVFADAGVHKLRLTGGEPLLRKGLDELVAMLAQLRTPAGDPLDLTLTTNGSILARKAAALKEAGLTRITVSLDAIDDAVFRAMNDVGFAVEDVLEGIDAALAAGLAPVKVNMVVKKGTNDGQIVPLARALQARYGTQVVLRFIEFMDVGATNGWRLDDVLPSRAVLERLRALGPLEPLPPSTEGETARRWRFVDSGAEIGLISSVTQAFCGTCSRARLSTDGQLFLCLFGSHGHDLRRLVRGGASDAEIADVIDHVWAARDDRYSELRTAETAAARREHPAERARASRCTTSAAEPCGRRRLRPSPASSSPAAAARAWAASTRACNPRARARGRPVRPPAAARPTSSRGAARHQPMPSSTASTPLLASMSARSLPGSPAWPLTQCHCTSCALASVSSCCHSSRFFTGLPSAVFQPRFFQPWIQVMMPLRTYSLSV